MAGELASGRVLIADDEPHIREMLRAFLGSEGYEVATAATGGEALDTVPTFQPDVILIDMLMPDLSGADVLDALHRAGVTVPVILISGHHQATAREGFFGVLSKPFKLRRLAEVVAAAWATDGPRVPDDRRRLLLRAAFGFLRRQNILAEPAP